MALWNASLLATGNTPGRPMSIKSTCVLGSAPKPVEPPENSFDFVDN